MKPLTQLDHYRLRGREVRAFFGSLGDDTCGVFQVDSPTDSRPLFIVASTGLGWDHVSVSHRSRCPNWPEMEHIKRLFFEDHEVAMQLHVAVADHINHAEHCLHLWAPTNGLQIPLPPPELVGAPAAEGTRSSFEILPASTRKCPFHPEEPGILGFQQIAGMRLKQEIAPGLFAIDARCEVCGRHFWVKP